MANEATECEKGVAGRGKTVHFVANFHDWVTVR